MPARTRDKISFGSRDDRKQVENGMIFSPKFDDHGLITAVTVDFETNEVLMVAYMNEESLKMTIELGEAVYWSRSRKELWHKGATSGQTQEVQEIRVDCDQDALVVKVKQNGGGCCHTGRGTCFYRRLPHAQEWDENQSGPIPLF